MSKRTQCQVTGKKSITGGGYSNRVRATKFNPTGKKQKRINIQKKKITVPGSNKKVTVHLTSKGMRTLKKRGIEKTLRKAKVI